MADSVGFFFNVEKFFGSMSAQRMSFAEKGVYLVMLFQQWRDAGRNLPDDPAAVAELIAVTPEQATEVAAAWDVVRRKFVTSDHTPGRIWNVQVEQTRRQQRKNSKSRQLAGARGGKAAADGRRKKKEIQALLASNAIAKPSEAIANPSDKIRIEETRVDQRREEQSTLPRVSFSPTISGTTDPELADRAGAFVERYAELYPLHRRGARYFSKPNLDYVKACELCQVWDNARLERLAVVFLKCEEPFAVSGSRTIGQFAAMASWCDDRLREVESAA